MIHIHIEAALRSCTSCSMQLNYYTFPDNKCQIHFTLCYITVLMVYKVTIAFSTRRERSQEMFRSNLLISIWGRLYTSLSRDSFPFSCSSCHTQLEWPHKTNWNPFAWGGFERITITETGAGERDVVISKQIVDSEYEMKASVLLRGSNRRGEETRGRLVVNGALFWSLNYLLKTWIYIWREQLPLAFGFLCLLYTLTNTISLI